MIINWNIVDRAGQDHDVIAAKLRPKIAKLEKHLAHFPRDAVHLQIGLDSRASDKTYEVTLNLRVPSDVLHVSKESESLIAALDEGVNTLVRRLKRLKARYRKDHTWKHRRAERIPEREVAFTEGPLPARQGPQSREDAVVEVLKQDYACLLGFVSRRLTEYVGGGSIPRGAIDPHDIVDCVAEYALRNPELKPESMDYHSWCSSLAFRETRKAVRLYAEEARISVTVDLDSSPEAVPNGDDDLEPEELALNLLQNYLEPDETTLADLIPDPHAESPETEVARMDMLAALRSVSRQWPNTDREIFQLHFLEGMSVDDVAHAFGCERAAVETAVSRIGARLRSVLTELTGTGEKVRPSAERAESYAKHLHAVARQSKVTAQGREGVMETAGRSHRYRERESKRSR
ncbi:MAG: HPF/RaiA family ribosome-associated protein [Sedimentisphaerales bacterium]|nr:HPF/RaiA family ribosome-associated protein [Sedimentisphaerales bacterium]